MDGEREMSEQPPQVLTPGRSACPVAWRGLCGRLVLLGRDIKLSHTVFALPFALLAGFLAAGGFPGWVTLGLLVLCMVLARTAAMAVNRWADAKLDASNPRTADRAIPRGALGGGFVLGAAAVSGVCFVAATSGFWFINGNIWPLLLGPAVLAWLVLYSFTKRFTMFCHLFLGSALALSPIAASIAVHPGHLATAEPYLLAGMVLCWVAGFDVIYALQDVDVDRREALFSLPAKLGAPAALGISRVLHALSASALLALAWLSPQLGLLFLVASVTAAGLLVFEHAMVRGARTHRIPVVFLTVNGIISLLLGAAGIIDVLRL